MRTEREADAVAYNNRTRSGIQEYLLDFVDVQIATSQDDMDAMQQDETNGRIKYMDGHYYDDKIFSNVIPEGGSDLAAVSAQIEDYWSQQSASDHYGPFRGRGGKALQRRHYPDGSNGNEGAGRVPQRKIPEKTKKKMGVKFAWPRNQ